MADGDIWVAVSGLAGENISRMGIFGWQFWGWQVRIFGGWGYLGGSFRVGG